MSKVLITPNATTNQIVTAYKTKPDYGFIQLTQETITMNGSWIKESKRSTIMRGTVALLNKFVEANKSLQLPGTLIVKEYLESQVPQTMVDKYINKDIPWEEGISGFLKRAGKDAPELTVGGERILRFTEWDNTGQAVDMKVEHDNQAQLADWRAEAKRSAALLPS